MPKVVSRAIQQLGGSTVGTLCASSSLLAVPVKGVVKKLGKMGRSRLTTVSIFGLALSLYAIYVEIKKTANPDFDAICDISETMSCSKVFLSEQGKIWSWLGIIPKDSVFDQPNAVYGALFYCIVMFLDSLDEKNKGANNLLMLLGVAGLGLSALLAKILFFDLHDTCLVCMGSYVCNIVVFLGAFSRWKRGGLPKDLSHTSLENLYAKRKGKKA